MTDDKAEKSARQKIIDAAGDTFGSQGFKAATIRQICQAAGVNVAAINYHFGGKKELYRTVVEDLLTQTFARYPLNEGVSADSPPEARLRALIRGMLQRLLSPDGLSGDQGKGKLVARELAEPSAFLDDLVEKFIRPVALDLFALVSELLGGEAPFKQVMQCQISVIGQCFHYSSARPIISRLEVFDYQDPAIIDELTDHIAHFSLAGIDAKRKTLQKSQSEGDS